MLKFWASEFVNPVVRKDGTTEQYQVYPDDLLDGKFYIIPNAPTIRWNVPNASLAFKFIKYKFHDAVNAATKGGGYCVFDVELRIPDADHADIQKQLENRYKGKTIHLGTVPITDGTVKLLVHDGPGQLVESVTALGKPSLTGTNVASFAAELSQHGATLFYDALSTGKGGVIQVAYSLKTWARTDDTILKVSYEMKEVLDYVQKIEVQPQPTIWSEGSYKDTITEALSKRAFGKVDLIGGDQLTPSARDTIRQFGMDRLAEAVKGEIEKVLPPDPEKRKAMMAKGTTELIEKVDHNARYEQTLTEKFAFEMPLNPQGALPLPKALLPKGAYVESDYFIEAGLDDPFFQTLNVGVTPLIDFEANRIKAVKVDLNYYGSVKSFVFTKDPEKRPTGREPWGDVSSPAPFLQKKNGEPDRTYSYAYEIIYDQDGEIRTYKTEPRASSSTECVIAGGTEGLVLLAVRPDLLDLSSYTAVTVKLAFLHEDKQQKLAVEPLVFMKTGGKDVTQQVKQVVGTEAAKYRSYEYTVEYRFGNERRVVGPVVGTGKSLSIPELFGSVRTFTLEVRPQPAAGAKVVAYFEYTDAVNNYTRRETKELDSKTKFASQLAFGVFANEQGTLHYSGEIITDGAPTVELKRTVVPSGKQTIIIRPPRNQAAKELAVTVDPRLLAPLWNQLRRVQVRLEYRDANGEVIGDKRMLFDEKGKAVTQEFKFTVEGGRSEYHWSAAYTFNDDRKAERSGDSDDEFLDLPLPPAFEHPPVAG